MINLGLKRTARLLQLISQKYHQQQSFQPPWKVIHIAGTNGKGSVAAYLAALIKRADSLQKDADESAATASDVKDGGIRVGRFTSPHFIDRWDCIVINDKPVSEDIFTRAEAEVKLLAKQVEQELYEQGKRDLKASDDDPSGSLSDPPQHISEELTRDARPTEFEILTATAFKIFSDPHPTPCDIAVVECGLGGRLDSTNALPTSSIAVSIITRIGLDHLDILGGSLRSIVREKCGILREDVPVVVDGENNEEVLGMIREEVLERFGEQWMREMVSYARGADLVDLLYTEQQTSDIATNSSDESRHPRLQNLLPHQLTNLAIAVQAFNLLNQHDKKSTETSKNTSLLSPSLLETVLTDASKSYPARLQRLDPGWLNSTPSNHDMPRLNAIPIHLDGAHNEQSAVVLREYIDRERDRLARSYVKSKDSANDSPSASIPTRTRPNDIVPTIYILALSSTKPPLEILRTLLCDSDCDSNHTSATSSAAASPSTVPTNHIIFTSFSTPPSMPWVRSTPPSTLISTTSQLNLPNTNLHTTGSVVEALDLVETQLREYDGDGGDGNNAEPLIVVAGSLYLASDFLRFIRDGKDASDGSRG